MTSTRLAQSLVLKALTSLLVMVIAGIGMILLSEQASAHGWVDGPASRAILCKNGQNTDCGAIVYEPQSLEAPKGFPNAGPADGKIASANGAFPKLDEQSANRWTKVNISAGTNTFTWKFTAPHATANWKYYITKPGWDPNAPLTRNSFDLTPFCTVNYGGVQPPFTYSHTCNVPERTGYHVILAVWEIADTANAFYNVIDVDFGGGNSGDTTAPTAPTGLAATAVTSNSVTLSWNASSDNVGVTGYRVYNGSNLVGTVSGSTLSHTVTGLNANTSYTFTVRAVDGAGNSSSPSNPVTVTTSPAVNDTQAPSAPGNLHVMGIPTSSSVTLMWSPSTDNVGVTGYRIYRGSTLSVTVSGTETSFTVTGLSAATSYTFTVRAIDAAGNESAASNTVQVTTASAPAAQPWAPNTAYAVGELVSYNGEIYECRQAHTSLVGWEPPNVPALWLLK
ncbi:lytic polysaccharide monooxygenase [Paenibacillus barengoltzii]|uniref:Chitin-binding protein n=1 Tax=Paenibacillus barengoltzii J12 TaxID=935846 RepID=A0ABY1LWB0_9BACL|nr:lytic polysaccharide monooxygenase [Paenibacillus barengoltzii]MEC2344853.1 lytic polysaccharide monooxygenase [Paenibacillus barengoltzii]SMF17362.1 chitin-binding protein [Paenibacillus barengoltzii]SMF18744.1 chitin-binding protein [Paenibacillus barengoltzii J12]